MIITDKFVFLHYPKTGGLFVAKALKKVHERTGSPCQELMLPNMKKLSQAGILNEHGTYEQIPEEHRSKPIISCIRNPFDRYVSIYEFRNWIQPPPEDMPDILRIHPRFPDLSFEEYLDYINVFDIKSRAHHEKLRVDIGTYTYSFIQFFFQDPGRVFAEMDENYVSSGSYLKDMAKVRFLHTERLNLELHETLREFGYDPEDVSFVLNEERVNVTVPVKKNRHPKSPYTPALRKLVRSKERFIIRLFPEYEDPTDARR